MFWPVNWTQQENLFLLDLKYIYVLLFQVHRINKD